MVANQTSFQEDSVYKGRKAEDVIARILREEGMYVVITADNQDRDRPGAPGMRKEDDFLIMPDLLASKQGYTGWAEVKGKTDPTFTRITRRLEHGVPLKNFNHYKQIQEQTGLPVFLFVYEFSSGDVLYRLISELESIARIYEGDKMSKGGMVFFPRTGFHYWGRVVLVGDHQYDQLSLLDLIDQPVDTGGKLFKVYRN